MQRGMKISNQPVENLKRCKKQPQSMQKEGV
ncbi:unnamed protein product, partial [Onchocerca ochengi]|uniref:Transposase n=1 Tax=Onchocerca ochengi TaxID=42157 RepID=A0A182EUH9_ONCOC